MTVMTVHDMEVTEAVREVLRIALPWQRRFALLVERNPGSMPT
jgi:hypothetical protein